MSSFSEATTHFLGFQVEFLAVLFQIQFSKWPVHHLRHELLLQECHLPCESRQKLDSLVDERREHRETTKGPGDLRNSFQMFQITPQNRRKPQGLDSLPTLQNLEKFLPSLLPKARKSWSRVTHLSNLQVSLIQMFGDRMGDGGEQRLLRGRPLAQFLLWFLCNSWIFGN